MAATSTMVAATANFAGTRHVDAADLTRSPLIYAGSRPHHGSVLQGVDKMRRQPIDESICALRFD